MAKVNIFILFLFIFALTACRSSDYGKVMDKTMENYDKTMDKVLENYDKTMDRVLDNYDKTVDEMLDKLPGN